VCNVVKADADTFAGKFCSMNDVPAGRYAEAVLRLSLYPAARILKPVLALRAGYFAPDLEFISCVGRIRRMRDLGPETDAYILDPRNRGFLRRTLRLRVSAARLHRLARLTLRTGSAQPFQAGG
jgi:hypothetical protein